MHAAIRLILLALTMAVIAAPAFASYPNGRLLTSTGWWGSGSYVYDALDNIRTRNDGTAGTSTILYASANRVTSAVVNGAAQTYGYDGNFKRAKTVENPGSGSGAGGKTIYQVFSRVTGSLIYRDEATDGETTDYVSVGGAALRLKKAGGTLTPEYVHFDHQGSAVAATNASGAVLWRERYSPWGTRLLKPAGNKGDTGYTGHLMDNTTELVYMQARYYDSQIQRFYSTDPIGYQDQLNLYAYVGNDPVNKIDPNGESAVTLAIKFALKGGDLASTFAGVAEDFGTLTDSSASLGARALAAVSLASEFGPVSVGDAKTALKAADAAGDKAKSFFRGSKAGEAPSFQAKPNEIKIDSETGTVKPTHGVSVFDNPDSVAAKGLVPNEVDQSTVPGSLQIIQRGNDPSHFEITPKPGANLTPEQFQEALDCIECK